MGGFESFLSLDVGKRDNNLTTSVVGNSLQVRLRHSSNSNDPSLNEVLESEVINSSRAKDDVGSSSNDLLASFFADVHLSLSDLVEVFCVLAEDLDAHCQSEFVQVEVNEGNFGVFD